MPVGIGIGCGGFSERQAGTPAATPEGERERERLGERERSAEPQASVPVGIGDTPARPAGRDACRYTDQRNSLSSHAELQGNQSLSVAGFTHSKQRGAAIFRSCARVSRCFDGIGLFPKPWRGDLPPVRRGAIRYNAGLFLKCSERRKDGKVHRSWSVVEHHRSSTSGVQTRQVRRRISGGTHLSEFP